LMDASVGRSVAKNARRWRWLLYVVGVAARHDCLDGRSHAFNGNIKRR
jgi:hypothetical protein